MSASEALNFLKEDLEKAKKQWEEGKPFESLLQRSDTTLDELLEKFKYTEDETKWIQEYQGQQDISKMRPARAKIAFLKGSCKEFEEEYNEEITDVDYMRLLEIPFTESEYVIDLSIGSMKE